MMSWAWDSAAVYWYAPLATLTELRFHSPGLRVKARYPGLRLAVGVTRCRMMGCYFLMGIIRLSITPSAKRNTLPFRVAKRRAGDLRFSVAILLWFNTQCRGAAHLNPGLGKRNSYRVARGAHRLRGDNHTWLLVCISSTTTKLCITLGEHFIHCGITIHGGKGAHHRQRTNHA